MASRDTGILFSALAERQGCFLAPDDVVFLVVRGRDKPLRLFPFPEEVFGRAAQRIRPLVLRSTDYLGNACLHCGKPLEDPRDMVLALRGRDLVAVLHETCFKRWFVLQDKAGLPGYRFAWPKDTELVADDGVTRLQVDGTPEPVERAAFTALEALDYGNLAESRAEAEAAYVKGKAKAPGLPDDHNIVFCPRCDHPNQVPFLEMVGVTHTCGRCAGRFALKLIEL